MDTFESAIKYPFSNPKSLIVYWLILVPIFGWFPLMGYIFKISKEILKGNYKKTPDFGEYWTNFNIGFRFFAFLFVIGIITVIVQEVIGLIFNLLNIYLSLFLFSGMITGFILSGLSNILIMRYVETKKAERAFNLKKTWKIFSKTWSDYFFTLLKIFVGTLVLLIIPFIAFLITLLLPSLFLQIMLATIIMLIMVPAINYFQIFLIVEYYVNAKKVSKVKN